MPNPWHGAFATALMVISGGSQLAGMSESVCAVTPSNGHGLVRGSREPPAGNHGNENGTIATALPNDGTVTFKPGGSGCVEADGALWMKFPWWHKEKRDQLAIEGRRIDGEAPPLRSWIPASHDSEFQASALIFPTAGCWEVTGKVGQERLTFVVKVVRVAEGPRRCHHAR